MSAGNSLLEIVYKWFRAFRFFFGHSAFFFGHSAFFRPFRFFDHSAFSIIPLFFLSIIRFFFFAGLLFVAAVVHLHHIHLNICASRITTLSFQSVCAFVLRGQHIFRACATSTRPVMFSGISFGPFRVPFFLKAPRLSEAMCRRKECRGACGGSLNGGDRSGEAQLRELGHTCPDELSRAAAVSGNRSLIYICGSVCLYRFS